MEAPDERVRAKRSAEITAAVQFFTNTIQMASTSCGPNPPDQARAAIRIALVGVIKLISDLTAVRQLAE